MKNRLKVDYREFNEETRKSLEKGQMTERLALLALNMVYPTVKTYAKKRGVPKITYDEIIGNVVLRFYEKYLDKVDGDKTPYAFAIRMIWNLTKDQFRRLSRTDSLLSLSKTRVNGKLVQSTVVYFEDL
jgi:DNA-directed RNA polymerase specialized sigma24 family protein